MESYDVLRECIHETGVKVVASEMRLSTSLVYKWCQPRDDDSGADNPLDRLKRVVEVTRNEAPIQWLCQQFGGFFVANPTDGENTTEPALNATQSLLREFSDILAEVSSSLADDNSITLDEAAKIRKEWEELKSLAEAFVMACEAGVYYNPEAEGEKGV